MVLKELKNFLKGNNRPKVNKSVEEDIMIYTPINGFSIPLEEVSDPVFSEGVMGKGCGIIPFDDILCSPVSGNVATVFPTKHAIGIESDEGVEILIHIGVDTVELRGEGFEPYVKQGDYIEKGSPLIKVNNELIKEKGYDNTVIVIVVNSSNYKQIVLRDKKELDIGSVLLRVIR